MRRTRLPGISALILGGLGERCKKMNDQKDDAEEVKYGSLEHSDAGESLRQLWWTIGATLIGLALVAYFTL